MLKWKCFFIALVVSLSAWTGENDPVKVNIIQLNDVYEMLPLGPEGNTEGGLARVATLREQMLVETPNTYVILSGDLLSPSALSLANVPEPDGSRSALAGRQMAASMNVMGLDYITFGNHEFDLKQHDLLRAMEMSQFQWFSSNVFQADGTSFPNTPENVLFKVKSGNLKVGLFGLTLDSKKTDFTSYNTNLHGVAREQIKKLHQGGAQVIIAVTHLALGQDIGLADSVAGIDLILGGHEHENVLVKRGPKLLPVAKADANARTAYIHRLTWFPDTQKLTMEQELVRIDKRFAEQTKTKQETLKWRDLAFKSFKEEGVIDPEKLVVVAGEELDGTEKAVRNKPTALTSALASGMQASDSSAQAAFFNGGTIRLDDKIAKGQEITEYDVLRILPFGGNVKLATVEGSVLKKALDAGLTNKGKGGFLQRSSLEQVNGVWQINGQNVDDKKTYRIAVTDFLLTGQEENLGFFKEGEPGISEIKEGIQLSEALINGLKQAYP